MKKQLILFRHGKSDWGADYQGDHERPLAKRGVKAAKIMGRLLANSGQTPDVILTSTAVRALLTVRLAMQEGEWDACRLQTDAKLYDASPADALEIIKSTPASIGSLLVVGHEPTCSELLSLLIGGGHITFPTAAMARVDFCSENWRHISYGDGAMIWHLQPRFFSGSPVNGHNG